MEFRRAGVPDLAAVLRDHHAFWDGRDLRHLHHPLWVRELGDTAWVAEDAGVVAAYLFGLVATAEPVGYVHLVAVRASHRGRGLGRALWERFAAQAAARGCTTLRAVTTPGNAAS